MITLISILLLLCLCVAVYVFVLATQKPSKRTGTGTQTPNTPHPPQHTPRQTTVANGPAAAQTDAQQSNHNKGHLFEKYIVGLFDMESGRFKLKEWRSDKIADNGAFAESTQYPDIEIQLQLNNRPYLFAIECKWRSRFTKNGVDWAQPYQINNYTAYQNKKRIPVFVAIGIGGQPQQPERLFVAPLEAVARFPFLYESYLQQFERSPNHRFFYNPQQKQLY